MSKVDWEESYLTSVLSKLIYKKVKDDIVNGAVKLGFPNVKFFQVKTNCGAVFYNDKKVIVVFKGVNEIDDYPIILSAFKVKREGMWIHNGFIDSWDYIEPAVRGILDNIKFDGKKLYFTGSSLGGALSVLGAYYLKSIYPIRKVYTFGMPRIGNWGWRSCFNKSGIDLIRFVNDQDPIPKLPFWFYFHVGKVVYFDKDGDIVRFRPLFFMSALLNVFSDHAMSKYIKKIKKYL